LNKAAIIDLSGSTMTKSDNWGLTIRLKINEPSSQGGAISPE